MLLFRVNEAGASMLLFYKSLEKRAIASTKSLAHLPLRLRIPLSITSQSSFVGLSARPQRKKPGATVSVPRMSNRITDPAQL